MSRTDEVIKNPKRKPEEVVEKYTPYYVERDLEDQIKGKTLSVEDRMAFATAIRYTNIAPSNALIDPESDNSGPVPMSIRTRNTETPPAKNAISSGFNEEPLKILYEEQSENIEVSEEEPSISHIKDDEYCLLISDKIIAISSDITKIESIMEDYIFNDKVQLQDLIVLKRLPLKTGILILER